MKTDMFLRKMEDLARDQKSMIENTFLDLDTDLLKKRPSEDKWSIAECFAHLNLTLDIYLPQMDNAIEQTEKYTPPAEEFKYSLLGKLALYAMEPKKDKTFRLKMKTFKKLEPQQSDLNSKEELNHFIEHQEKTNQIIEDLKKINIGKAKIITAMGPLLKMRIGDALHFMLAHNQRHILQAQNVLQKSR